MPIKNLEIRTAQPGDARLLNQYIKLIYATSKHLITRPEEYIAGPWKQRLWISRKLARKDEVCLLAIHSGSIVGMIDNWVDRRQRVCHVTTFAMSVHPEHRGKGIGKHLLGEFINWARKHDTLEKIELHVHEDNIGARQLYEKMGFEFEGQRKKAIKYADGRVIDDILMAYWA